MTNQVQVIIRAEDQGGQKALTDFSRGLESAAVTAERSATRQSASFAKVRAELSRTDIAQRRASAEVARQREADSQKTLGALIDDALRLQTAQRKSALDTAAAIEVAERRRVAAVEKASRESRQALAAGLRQQEADNARSIEIIRAQNEAARRAETAAAVAEVRRRRSAEVAEASASARAQRQINARFTSAFSGRDAAESGSAFEAAGLTSYERALQRDRDTLAGYRTSLRQTIGLEREAAAAATSRGNAQAAAGRRASASAVGSFASGVGAAAGVGFGAGPLGAGIATALGVGFSSQQAIELERANAALTAVTGSSTEAGQALAFVREQAERLGVSVTTLSLQYSRFEAAAKGTALEGARTRDIFLAITEAGQRLNLRSEQVEGALNAVTQIISKGSVQAEELRGQLGDRLPGAFNIMARALGVTTRELDKMLRTGEVLAADALPKFAAELRRTFDTDANTRINTTVSNFTRLTNEIRLAAAAFGEFANGAAGPVASGIANALRQARLESDAQRLGLLREFNIERSAAEREGRVPQSLEDFLSGPLAREASRRAAIEAATTGFNANALLQPRSRDLIATDPLLPGLTGARGATSRTGLTGEALLSSGQAPLDETEFRNSTRERIQAQGKLNELTQLEIFLQREAAGEFAGKNALVVENYRQIAIATDANNARLKAEREGKRELRAEDQSRVRDLKAALEVEEQQREEAERSIRTNLARAEALREEIRLGRELTAVERARITARVGRTVTAGLTVAGSEDVAASADRDARLDQNLRAFQFAGSQREGDIKFATADLSRNDIQSRIAAEQRQIELEARRLLVGATQEQTTAIIAQADAQMQLVEVLLTQQDTVSRDAVVGARRTLQQLERDSTNAATAISEALTNGFRSAEEAVTRFALTGKFSFRDFVGSVLSDLARLAAQRGISGLLSLAGNALFSAFGGGAAAAGVPGAFTGGGFGSGNGLQIGPGRANGGSVFPDNLYPVVERGAPETFRTPRGDTYLIPPASGGVVTPLRARSGSGEATVNINQSFDFSGRSAQDIAALQNYGQQIKRETMSAVFDALRRRTANV